MKTLIRSYPHFDPALTDENAKALVSSAESVCQHAFFPFLEYERRWTRFAKAGQRGETKPRSIKYAARRDFYIFAHYREILQAAYETELRKLGLGDSILAYRRIPTATGKGNKCNIHFAKDAFDRISELGDCYVYALDISKFFDSLDHQKIKAIWASLLGVRANKFPADHFAVYEAITRFAYVDREKALLALGYTKRVQISVGQTKVVMSDKRMRQCLCSGSEFRKKISDLIETNKKPYGIPQGAPISDVIANFYLMAFDKRLREAADRTGGFYYRYSDDILLVVPMDDQDPKERLREIQACMKEQGNELSIQDKKSSIFRFHSAKRSPEDKQLFDLIFGTQGKNGLEYLGFRFDGKAAYLRDSTISGLNRRIVVSAGKQAHLHVSKRPEMNLVQLRDCFDYKALIARFSRVRDFESQRAEHSKWTFITYVKRSVAVFGTLGHPIHKQLKRHQAFIRRKADEELGKLVS